MDLLKDLAGSQSPEQPILNLKKRKRDHAYVYMWSTSILDE